MKPTRDQADRRIARIEAAACAVLIVLAAVLILSNVIHAGPLWRDEINTRWVSTRPNLWEVWRWMEFDSYPALWILVVRYWIFAGLGEADAGLRALGALVGLGEVAAIWLVARMMGRRPPILALALFALSPFLFRFGTSLRANGLGTMTMILMVGAIWAYVDRPSARRLALAAVFSVLSVQTLYYNSIAVFVACCAGFIVFLTRRRYLDVVKLGMVGAVAAASVVPYALGPVARAKQWNAVVGGPDGNGAIYSFMTFQARLISFLDATAGGLAYVWLAMGLCVYVGLLISWFKWRSARRRSRALFMLLAVPGLCVFHFGFLLAVGYITQPWYYVTLLIFLAVMIDRGADMMIRVNARWRVARLVLVSVLAAGTFFGSYEQTRFRATNMDVIASVVAKEATRDDYVLVMPWYVGVSFAYYYDGPAPWTTVPAVADLQCHRYDLVKTQITHPRNIEPIKLRIRQTLDSGHRVWVIGTLPIPPQGVKPMPIPVAPSMGWNHAVYDQFWAAHIGSEVSDHAYGFKLVDLSIDQPVSPYESQPLFVFEGRPR